MKTVAIIGASVDRNKYGNKSIRAHQRQGWKVFAVNPRGGEIEGAPGYRRLAEIPEKIDRVSMYVSPEIGITLLEEIAAAKPDELFLNPGSESDALVEKARLLGLDPILACSIIDVGLSPSSL